MHKHLRSALDDLGRAYLRFVNAREYVSGLHKSGAPFSAREAAEKELSRAQTEVNVAVAALIAMDAAVLAFPVTAHV